eukprot:m.21499 g.21499  ORF g.21499 m.21499 type:complete len:57 (+) comp7160_c0_seq1:222-392(+)
MAYITATMAYITVTMAYITTTTMAYIAMGYTTGPENNKPSTLCGVSVSHLSSSHKF